MVPPGEDGHLPTAEEVRGALSRAVASRQVPDASVMSVAKMLAGAKLPIRAIDICTHGICIDYVFQKDRWAQAIQDMVLMKGAGIHSITIFPWGIPVPDVFRMRVEHAFDALGRNAGPG